MQGLGPVAPGLVHATQAVEGGGHHLLVAEAVAVAQGPVQHGRRAGVVAQLAIGIPDDGSQLGLHGAVGGSLSQAQPAQSPAQGGGQVGLLGIDEAQLQAGAGLPGPVVAAGVELLSQLGIVAG